jgi:ATP-dependent DNA helicase RecQ
MLFGLGDIRMRRLFIEQEDAPDDHKRRAHARLDTLVGFCEATECRRQILLRYFGETAVPCGHCDNCLDQAPRADGTVEALLVLAAVSQTGERFGPAHIVDVLRGHETQKIQDRNHHRLPSFGTGSQRKTHEWQGMIRQMVAGGFLALDVAGHGGLAIAEMGHALLRGEGAFRYRPDAPRAAFREKGRAVAEITASPETAALLATLKVVRLRLARERDVPAYVIFSDRTLIDMAERRPRTMDEFAAVNGVGAAKLKDFGRVFVDAIADFAASHE